MSSGLVSGSDRRLAEPAGSERVPQLHAVQDLPHLVMRRRQLPGRLVRDRGDG